MHLIPKEQLCPECPNVPLSKPFIITKSAKIISLKGVVEGKCHVKLTLSCIYLLFQVLLGDNTVMISSCNTGVTTYSKKCSSCGMMIRYQEWEDGVHNFDDRVILTLHFCIYLRICLQVIVQFSRCEIGYCIHVHFI